MLSLKKKLVIYLLSALLAATSVVYFSWWQKLLWFGPHVSSEQGADFLTTADGLKVSVFADNLTGPRVIAFDSKGRMAVSETEAGQVVLLEDVNGDGTADGSKTLIDGLDLPHGLAFYTDKQGTAYLYIALAKEVRRYNYDTEKSEVTDRTGENIANYPTGELNPLRNIIFAPNLRQSPIIGNFKEAKTMSRDKLYISVGSICDVCVEQSWKSGAILESDPEGTYTAEFAGGLRNSSFFTFDLVSGRIWAVEEGREGLGENLPPDEINAVEAADTDTPFGARRYGWPFCYGNQKKDPNFNPEKVSRTDIPTDCAKTESPAILLPAHSEPLGLAFVPKSSWSADWEGNLLVAYHSPQNSKAENSCKIVRFDLKNTPAGQNPVSSDFITGWRQGNKILGCPVDLKFGPDNALYVSDDMGGKIYKIIFINS